MSGAEADILARVGSLNLWKRHGERAPHKPLLILCESLSRGRPAVHSEADFQHALAWHIHERHLEEATGVPYGVGDAVAFSPAGSAVVRGRSVPIATYVLLVPEDTEVRSAVRVPWTS